MKIIIASVAAGIALGACTVANAASVAQWSGRGEAPCDGRCGPVWFGWNAAKHMTPGEAQELGRAILTAPRTPVVMHDGQHLTAMSYYRGRPEVQGSTIATLDAPEPGHGFQVGRWTIAQMQTCANWTMWETETPDGVFTHSRSGGGGGYAHTAGGGGFGSASPAYYSGGSSGGSVSTGGGDVVDTVEPIVTVDDVIDGKISDPRYPGDPGTRPIPQPAPVPLPAAGWMMLVALAGLAMVRRDRA